MVVTTIDRVFITHQKNRNVFPTDDFCFFLICPTFHNLFIYFWGCCNVGKTMAKTTHLGMVALPPIYGDLGEWFIVVLATL